jgi:hypothetical protein
VNSIAKKTLQAIQVIDYVLVLEGKDGCTFIMEDPVELKETRTGSAIEVAFEDGNEIKGFEIRVTDQEGGSTLTANEQTLEGNTLSLGRFKTEDGRTSEGVLSHFQMAAGDESRRGITFSKQDIEAAEKAEDLLQDKTFTHPHQKAIFIKALATIKEHLIDG